MFPNVTGPKSIIGSMSAFGKGQSYWQSACLKSFAARVASSASKLASISKLSERSG